MREVTFEDFQQDEVNARFLRDSHPNYWLNYANNFRQAALNSVECFEVFHYLCGTTIELLLKAYLVMREDDLDDITALSHKIPELYKRTNLKCLNANELKVLRGYGLYVDFRGKYPTAKTKEKHNELYVYYENNHIYSERGSNEKFKIVTQNSKTLPSKENFENIWNKLFIEYLRLRMYKNPIEKQTCDTETLRVLFPEEYK